VPVPYRLSEPIDFYDQHAFQGAQYLLNVFAFICGKNAFEFTEFNGDSSDTEHKKKQISLVNMHSNG